MKIQPETLRKLRKGKGLSQQALADEARIDKKTVARIEGGKGETRGSTVKQIAKALRVEPQVLAQEPESEAMEDEVFQKHGFRRAKFYLHGETVRAYDLVEDRYGVDMRQIIDAAPMLFTLLAEMSLNERRHRLEEMEEGFKEFPGHLLFGADYIEALSAEKSSINGRDVFGRRIASEAEWRGGIESYFYEEDRSPFLDFLIDQAKSLGPGNDAINHEDICNYGNFDDLPSARLFEAFRERLTGESSRADYALSRGYVRLGQIPKQLRGEDEEDEHVVSERVKWLEARVPDDDWAEHERFMASIDTSSLITNESPSEGGTEDA